MVLIQFVFLTGYMWLEACRIHVEKSKRFLVIKFASQTGCHSLENLFEVFLELWTTFSYKTEINPNKSPHRCKADHSIYPELTFFNLLSKFRSTLKFYIYFHYGEIFSLCFFFFFSILAYWWLLNKITYYWR